MYKKSKKGRCQKYSEETYTGCPIINCSLLESYVLISPFKKIMYECSICSIEYLHFFDGPEKSKYFEISWI